jgi:hypothetical protein
MKTVKSLRIASAIFFIMSFVTVAIQGVWYAILPSNFWLAAAIITAIAVLAFAVAEILENRIHKKALKYANHRIALGWSPYLISQEVEDTFRVSSAEAILIAHTAYREAKNKAGGILTVTKWDKDL